MKFWFLDNDRLLFHQPMAVMEWKAKHKKRLPKKLFFPHDEDWIAKYSQLHPDVLGMLVAVYFLPTGNMVFWKTCRNGVFSEVQSSPPPNE